MLVVIISVLLISLAVVMAVVVPLVGLHYEALQDSRREHLDAMSHQEMVIADYEATIDGYRRYARSEPEAAAMIR